MVITKPNRHEGLLPFWECAKNTVRYRVFTTAGVALELDARKNGDNTLEEQEKLPLTAGEEG
ncbi:hypothetical protein V6C16_11255 [Desulfovibrio sp. 1188_IL3213]|uniref:hypothetical protein n=1 Tax=Desulfovibrio sp. 1188_IL3213 TaxID=3084052 RepID=UPI002FDA3B2F